MNEFFTHQLSVHFRFNAFSSLIPNYCKQSFVTILIPSDYLSVYSLNDDWGCIKLLNTKEDLIGLPT